MKATRLIFCIVIFTLLLTGVSFAEIPRMINYQGKLTDTAGNPIDGARSITFNIYDQQAGGAPIWTETQTVTAANGIFTTKIGATKDLNLSFDRPYYLAIKIASDAEMPRSALSSSAYAFRAKESDMAVSIKGVDKAGLILECNSTSPNSKIDINADSLNIEGVIKSSINLTVDVTINGSNGLDTGVESSSNWYYSWVIYNPATDMVAGLVSVSYNLPVLPFGYTKKRLVGAVRNDAAGNFIKFYQKDNFVLYDDMINKGRLSANEPSWSDLDLSAEIPRISSRVHINTMHDGGVSPASSSRVWLRRNGSLAIVGQYYANLYSGYQSTTGFVDTDSSGLIEYKFASSAGGGVTFYVTGFFLDI